MTARHSLDQIERGLDGVTADHERIWLQNANDAHGCEGRLWCQDKVWPEDDEQGEPTEYVRADLFHEIERERDELKDAKWAEKHVDTMNDMASLGVALEGAEARATAAEATVTALAEALKPFSELAENFMDDDHLHAKRDENTVWGFNDHDLTYGDFRRARTILSQIRSEK